MVSRPLIYFWAHPCRLQDLNLPHRLPDPELPYRLLDLEVPYRQSDLEVPYRLLGHRSRFLPILGRPLTALAA